jgi:ParB-like chromosome segregation protein Spo0J
MGPPENHTSNSAKQAGRRRRRKRARRPRVRGCLLKGCERRFHPRQAGQRYCSPQCREAARAWSRWKAQRRYRETAVGQQKRNGQSRRYRERVRSRKPPEPEAVGETARVITPEHFFRVFLRPAGLLRMFRAAAAKSLQRFCSALCRRALERVRERERRWKQERIQSGHIDRKRRFPLHSACRMQLEFHQLDRRWERLRALHPARQRRLLASLAESGQQTPIVVVAAEGQPGRYVVIDGTSESRRWSNWGGTQWKRSCGR